jgi:hypothetical protein
MKRAAVVLLIAAGSAMAESSADTPSDSMSMESSSANASTIYEVDENRDGRADRLLLLEQSDSLA